MPTSALPPISTAGAAARGASPTLKLKQSVPATAAVPELRESTAAAAAPPAEDPSVLSFADSCLGDSALQNERLPDVRVKANVVAVKTLNLRGCNIHRGETVLAFLQAFPNVECLLLEWNSLGLSEDAMKLLCQALAKSTILHEVDLRNNRLGPTGGLELAAVLAVNTSIQRVDLRWNSLGVVGGRAIAEAVNHNTLLVDLKLAGNAVLEDTVEIVEAALQRNRALRTTDERRRTEQNAELDRVLLENARVHDELHRRERELEAVVAQLDEAKALLTARAEASREAETALAAEKDRTEEHRLGRIAAEGSARRAEARVAELEGEQARTEGALRRAEKAREAADAERDAAVAAAERAGEKAAAVEEALARARTAAQERESAVGRELAALRAQLETARETARAKDEEAAARREEARAEFERKLSALEKDLAARLEGFGRERDALRKALDEQHRDAERSARVAADAESRAAQLDRDLAALSRSNEERVRTAQEAAARAQAELMKRVADLQERLTAVEISRNEERGQRMSLEQALAVANAERASTERALAAMREQVQKLSELDVRSKELALKLEAAEREKVILAAQHREEMAAADGRWRKLSDGLRAQLERARAMVVESDRERQRKVSEFCTDAEGILRAAG